VHAELQAMRKEQKAIRLSSARAKAAEAFKAKKAKRTIDLVT